MHLDKVNHLVLMVVAQLLSHPDSSYNKIGPGGGGGGSLGPPPTDLTDGQNGGSWMVVAELKDQQPEFRVHLIEWQVTAQLEWVEKEIIVVAYLGGGGWWCSAWKYS